MKITIVYFGPFRDITGIKEEDFECDEEIILENLVEELGQKYGEKFHDEIFKNGVVKEHISILVDGQEFRTLKNFQTPVRDGNRVAFFFAIGGG